MFFFDLSTSTLVGSHFKMTNNTNTYASFIVLIILCKHFQSFSFAHLHTRYKQNHNFKWRSIKRQKARMDDAFVVLLLKNKP